METFVATRKALSCLEQSLQCSACQQLLTEPCTLGNCDHLICKVCAEQFAGNSCPACKAPAWAKDLQVKRELSMVVLLFRRLRRLISNGPDPTDASGKDSAKKLDGGRGGDRDGTDWTGDEGDNDDDMDLFAGHREDGDGIGAGDGFTADVHMESETEPMSISDSDDQIGVNQKMQCVQVEGSKTEPVSTSRSDGPETERGKGKKKRKLLPVKVLSGSKSKPGNKSNPSRTGQGRKRAGVDRGNDNAKENCAMSVYDFEASPPRPKTRRLKVQVRQQTRREVNLKKLAAANKTWGAVLDKRIPTSTSGKHVSFSDDSSLKSESSSAETADPQGTLRGKTRGKKVNETLTRIKDRQVAAGSRHDSPKAQGKTTQLKSKGKSSTVAGKGNKNESHQNAKKSPQGDKSSPKTSPKQKAKARKLPAKPEKGGGRVPGGNKHRQSSKNSPHPSHKEDDEDEVSMTPRSSRKSGVKRRSLTRGSVTSSPNSSFSSPKSTLTKRNKQGETLLHVACIKGDVTEVKSLLEQGADPNSRDNAGWTPLHEACNHGHSLLLSLLLDHGALINAPGGFEHDSPLHDAVNNNRLDVIRFLRQRGASLETRNIHGQTPMELASTAKMREALMTTPLVNVMEPSDDATAALPSQHLRDRPVVLLGTGLKPKEKSALQKCADLLDGRVVDDFGPDVTHLVAACEEEGEGLTCLRTMKYMQAVLAGRWVVTFAWVRQCIKKREQVAEVEFEIPGTTADPDSNAARRARENLQKQFPGLFDGCHFYFSGTFNHPTPPKTELTQLIKLGGGIILNRQPKTDDDVIQSSSVVPYHAKAESALASCAYYILYDHLGRKAPITIRSRKVCTVPVYWLLDCISQFAILEPPRE